MESGNRKFAREMLYFGDPFKPGRPAAPGRAERLNAALGLQRDEPEHSHIDVV
jgi:hypothetical protein